MRRQWSYPPSTFAREFAQARGSFHRTALLLAASRSDLFTEQERTQPKTKGNQDSGLVTLLEVALASALSRDPQIKSEGDGYWRWKG